MSLTNNPKKVYHFPFMLNANCIDPWAYVAEKQTAVWQFSLAMLDARVTDGGVLNNPQNVIQATFTGGKNAQNQPFIDVHLSAVLQMSCQRCLKTMDFTLNNTVRTLIFADENAANRADELNDDVDVLVVGKEISVVEWIEDQLLTALPFAPTHSACEMVPLLDNTPSNPFSVLKNL